MKFRKKMRTYSRKNSSYLKKAFIASNFNEMCRLCLSELDLGLTPIFQEFSKISYQEYIQYTVDVLIEEGDGLPGNICEECLAMVEQTYLFKKKCKASDSKLREHLELLELKKKGKFKERELTDFSEDHINLFHKEQGDCKCDESSAVDTGGTNNKLLDKEQSEEMQSLDEQPQEKEALEEQAKKVISEEEVGKETSEKEPKSASKGQVLFADIEFVDVDQNDKIVKRYVLKGEIRTDDQEVDLTKCEVVPLYSKNDESLTSQDIRESFVTIESSSQSGQESGNPKDAKIHEICDLWCNEDEEDEQLEEEEEVELLKVREKQIEQREHVEKIHHVVPTEHVEQVNQIQQIMHLEETEQTEQVEHIKQMEQVVRIGQMGQVVQVGQFGQVVEMEPVGQIVQIEQMDQVGQVVQMEPVGQVVQVVQMEQMQPMEQVVQVLHIEQLGQLQQVKQIKQKELEGQEGRNNKGVIVKNEKRNAEILEENLEVSEVGVEGNGVIQLSKVDKLQPEVKTKIITIKKGKFFTKMEGVLFKCSSCSEEFSTGAELKKHLIKVHHELNDSAFCEICGKSFVCLNNLRRHMFIHSGQKPHKCKVCGRTFSQGSILKRHLFTHETSKPYNCQVCGKGYTQKVNLMHHFKSHGFRTEEETFTCHYCNKVFLHQSGLSRHSNSHKGIKFSCKHCDRIFGDASALARHIKAIHWDK